MPQAGLILLAILFVLLNAFFVAAEFAMVKLRHSQAQQLKKKHALRGGVLFQVHTHLDTYLSACQLGITLASLGLGWVGESAFAHVLMPVISFFSIDSPDLIKLISFGAAFAVISFLHIVVGELMPKSMAIRQAEKISLWTALPLYIFYWAMYPFIWILNASANILLKLCCLDSNQNNTDHYSTEELKFILKSSYSHNELDKMPREMLVRLLEFTQLQAVDIMRPVDEMISMSATASLQEKIGIINKYRYTRYPVYLSGLNNNKDIIGLIHAKDLLIETQLQENMTLRKIIKVNRSTQATKILEQFRSGMTHFALVYNTDQKLIGFMTLDDLLHVLMGKIGDEFNLTREDWQALPDGSYLLKGTAPVYVIETILEIDLSDYKVDTVAGLILEALGQMPVEDDEWQGPGFILKVSKMKGPRIVEVILIKK